MRRLRWSPPDRPRSARPVRDSALVYGALALVIVVFSLATGGSLARAAVIAILFYVAAMAWAIFSWRRSMRQEEGRP